MSFVYTFGGNVVQAANQGYNDIIYNANVQLAWPTQFQDVLNVTAAVLYLSPTAGGLIVILPDATLASTGQVLLIINHTAHDTTLETFLGGQSFPVNTGTAQFFILRDNSTQDGSWDVLPAGGGVVAVTSVAAVTAAGVTSANLNITGSPITSAGTFTFTLQGDLFALGNFGAGTGLATRTAANTWALRTITGTPNQITVTNGSGVAGNPTISLPTIITGINNLTVGDLNFSANTITTTVANQSLLLTPNGTGNVFVSNTSGTNVSLAIQDNGQLILFNAGNTNFIGMEAGNRTTNITLILPTVDPALGQAAIVTALSPGEATLSWATIATTGAATTVNALARYLNTTGSLNNSTVLLDNFGNLTNINSAVIGNIQLGAITANTISTSAGSIVLTPNGVSPIQLNASTQILNGNSLTFFEPSGPGNNFTSFIYPASNFDLPYLLPTTPPTLGQIIYITSTAGGEYTWTWGNAPNNQNLLMNGGMLVWQRNTSFTNATFQYVNNNDSYTADRWNLQSNGNNIVNVSRHTANFTNPLASSLYSLRSTVVTANTKFGYVQVVNALDTSMIAGRTVTLQMWNAVNGISNLRAAWLAWTGTADVPLLTSGNFIAAWNAQGADPTLAANWAYVAPSFSVNSAAPFTQSILGPTTINTAGINNLALFVWCDNTGAAATSTWDMTCVKAEFGTVATPFFANNFEIEREACMSYFQKDISYGTALGTTNVGGPFIFTCSSSPVAIPNGSLFATVFFRSNFYNIPSTVFTYGYNPATQNVGFDQTYGATNANSFTPSPTPNDTTTSFFQIYNNSGGTIGPWFAAGCHWFADGDF